MSLRSTSKGALHLQGTVAVRKVGFRVDASCTKAELEIQFQNPLPVLNGSELPWQSDDFLHPDT